MNLFQFFLNFTHLFFHRSKQYNKYGHSNSIFWCKARCESRARSHPESDWSSSFIKCRLNTIIIDISRRSRSANRGSYLFIYLLVKKYYIWNGHLNGRFNKSYDVAIKYISCRQFDMKHVVGHRPINFGSASGFFSLFPYVLMISFAFNPSHSHATLFSLFY